MQTIYKDLPYRSNVGIMLVNDDGYVFVGQRLDNNQNAWQMPQGGIDGNEDPETARHPELNGFGFLFRERARKAPTHRRGK